MKKFTFLIAIILTANLLLAQYNKIDTSFYSEALQEGKMVDIYFPPGYDENPERLWGNFQNVNPENPYVRIKNSCVYTKNSYVYTKNLGVYTSVSYSLFGIVSLHFDY